MYAPGTYYLNALAFRTFGVSVGVVRTIWTLLHALITVEALVLGRRLGGRMAGWLTWVLALASTLVASPNSGYPAVPALAVALGALIVFASGRAGFVVGGLTGVTAVFRHDFGIYLTVSVAAGLALRGVVSRQPFADQLLRFLAGASIVAGPVYGAMGLAAGLRPMTEQLLTFPLVVLPPYAYLPLIAKPVLWIPVVIVVLAALVIVATVWRYPTRLAENRLFLMALLCLLGLGLVNHARFRFDPVHVWPLMIATVPLVAAAPFLVGPAFRRLAAIAGLLATLGLYAAIAIAQLEDIAKRPTVPLQGPRGSGIKIPKFFAVYNDLLQTVQSETRPGEAIFSGAVRHDRIDGNDVLLYFLTGRPAAGPYHELTRGLVTTERVQREIVQALEKRQVRVVVLLNVDSREPNQSSVSSGVTLLDDHIRDHFAQIGKFGAYELWRRR